MLALRDAEERGLRSAEKAVERAESGSDGAGLVSAVDHAVAALGIAALESIVAPSGSFHQFAERLAIAFAEQVAGSLPAENAVRGTAPRLALEVVVAAEEFEEEGRLIEAPGATRAGQQRAEQVDRLT